MFLLLQFLFSISLALTYTFGNVTLNINYVSTGNITNYSSGDQCHKIITRNAQVYHASAEKVYQSWPKGSLNVQTSLQNISGTASTLKDFSVSEDEKEVAFITSDTTNGRIIYTLNTSYQVTSTTSHSQTIAANSVAINGSELILTTQDFGTFKTYLTKVDLSGTVLLNKNTTILNRPMVATPDFQKVLVWSDWSTVKIYDTLTLT